MSQITGKSIFERYNITLNELLQHMQRGLPATTQGGAVVYSIDNPMEGPTQEERFQAGIHYTNTIIKLRNQRGQNYKTILDFSEFLDGYYGISMELSKGDTTSLTKDVESFLFSEKDLLRYLNWPDDMILEPFLFKHLDIDALKIIAGRWAEDYYEKSVRVQTISIHPVAMPIPWAEVLPGQRGPQYAVVFHCPDCTRDDLPNATDSAENHLEKVEEEEFSPYVDLWSDLQNKSKHLFYRGLFESVYLNTPQDNWISEWRFVFKYSGETIPLDVVPDAGVVLFPPVDVMADSGVMPYPVSITKYQLSENSTSLICNTKSHYPETRRKKQETISSALTKSWEPEKELPTRASKEEELAIWNNWIKPIVVLHYNGAVKYIYFSEPRKLSYDEFEKMWELSVAPFLCSCKLPGIKIPASKTQAEVEDLIISNIWEPNLFVSEVLLPLKAGRGLQFVDSFLGCLISIIDGKDLPAFLAYISQTQGKNSMIDTEEKQANTYFKEPDYEKILADICIEVEKFYNDLTKEIELAGNYKFFAEISDSSELLQIAVDYFETHKGNYSKLELAHFNDETIFHTQLVRPRRRIIGIILQKYCKAMGIKKPPSIDYLATLHNTIIRD